jgi:hypothetical protein
MYMVVASPIYTVHEVDRFLCVSEQMSIVSRCNGWYGGKRQAGCMVGTCLWVTVFGTLQ